MVSVGGRKLIEMQRAEGDPIRTSSLGNGRKSSKEAEGGGRSSGGLGPQDWQCQPRSGTMSAGRRKKLIDKAGGRSRFADQAGKGDR